MYHVSAQGVDERMTNVHYYYVGLSCCVRVSPFSRAPYCSRKPLSTMPPECEKRSGTTWEHDMTWHADALYLLEPVAIFGLEQLVHVGWKEAGVRLAHEYNCLDVISAQVTSTCLPTPRYLVNGTPRLAFNVSLQHTACSVGECLRLCTLNLHCTSSKRKRKKKKKNSTNKSQFFTVHRQKRKKEKKKGTNK